MTLHAPAQVQQQAAQNGLQLVPSARFVTGQPVAIDLTAPVGAPASDLTPLWMRMFASLINTIGGTKDVLASTSR